MAPRPRDAQGATTGGSLRWVTSRTSSDIALASFRPPVAGSAGAGAIISYDGIGSPLASTTAAREEWLKSWISEVGEGGGVLGMRAAEELAAVPGVDEELDRVAQRLDGAGEAARAPPQAGQIVTELSVVGLHRRGLARVGQRLVLAGVVHQVGVGPQLVRVVLLSLRRVIDEGLQARGLAIAGDIVADNAAGGAIYGRDDGDAVLFSPANVESSSSSATAKGAGALVGGAGGVSGSVAAGAATQLATVWWTTPSWRAIRRRFRPSTERRTAWRRTGSSEPWGWRWGGVAASTGLAQGALAAGRIAAGLDLPVGTGAERAGAHATSLPDPPSHVYPFSHSRRVRGEIGRMS